MTNSQDALLDLAEYITESLGADVVAGHEVSHEELVLHVKHAEIARALLFLRDDRECAFKILLDICGADYPDRSSKDGGRFDVLYHLLSVSQNQRVRIKITTDENEAVPSVASVFSSAGWYEREAWDMYGIYFDGNVDLRRILTDYGFEGHPLRKDFPLSGHVEVRYDENARRVVYEPVSLPQEYRDFDNVSPWEGVTDVQLPGDEKAVSPAHGYRGTVGKGGA